MEYRIIVSGFGGQGVLFLGKVLAEASVRSGREVSWLPSYGPEMRGGTANCRVVVSDSEIISPSFTNANGLIAMNLPSLEKFKGCATDVLVTDEAFGCPGAVNVNTESAAGGERFDGLTNMIMLGAFAAKTDLFDKSDLYYGIEKVAGEKRAKIDIEAFDFGYGLKM